MKLFYMFGAQRQRLEWEWVAWSVLLSLVIDALTTAVVQPWLVSRRIEPSVADVLARVALALSIAAFGIILWRFIKRSDLGLVVQVRRAMTDSAWDEVLDDSVVHGRWVQVDTDVNGHERSFLGWVRTAGREDANAERWLYLERVCDVTQKVGASEKSSAEDPKELGFQGLLIHRDQVRRLWVLKGQDDGRKPEPWWRRVWPNRKPGVKPPSPAPTGSVANADAQESPTD
jgi:hypothetical protein